MFQKRLPRDEGLLFIFNEDDTHAFWMKNMLIPLDILWIDSAKKIVFISKNTQPCHTDICASIEPPVKARYVLEVNAGTADAWGLTTGDTLEF